MWQLAPVNMHGEDRIYRLWWTLHVLCISPWPGSGVKRAGARTKTPTRRCPPAHPPQPRVHFQPLPALNVPFTWAARQNKQCVANEGVKAARRGFGSEPGVTDGNNMVTHRKQEPLLSRRQRWEQAESTGPSGTRLIIKATWLNATIWAESICSKS